MITRREVLGAGVALTAVSGVIGLNFASTASEVSDQNDLMKVRALILDEGISVSTKLVASLRTRTPNLELLTSGLDSFTSIELKRIFNSGVTIAGISSGATLFCLERIAWDYGYRITRRSEHEFNVGIVDAHGMDSMILALANSIMSNKPEFLAAASATSNRAYRPSRSDDTLHAWIVQTAVTSKNRTV